MNYSWQSNLDESRKVWGKSYIRLEGVLLENKCKKGVEVGIAFGGNSENILKKTEVVKLTGIDSYKHIDGYNDPMNITQPEFDSLYQFVKSKFSVYKDRYKLIRKLSSEAVNYVEGNQDFVYIDADHSYNGVKQDIGRWFSKVKLGGIICGHDYNHEDFPGVKRAVDSFFGRFRWEIIDEGDFVWWVKKKNINISYIIPAYNCQDTIEESVDSIFNGNFETGDEVVVVNDCSTDKTAVKLAKLKTKYGNKIKIVNHLRNKGGAAARNTAVENSSNNLIFCLDSDNILVKGSVSKLKNYLIETGADVASFREIRFFRDGRKLVTHVWDYGKENITLDDCLKTQKVPGSSGNYLYTKDSWIKAGGYPEFAGALDTWGFGFRQLATGSTMVTMDNSFYLHKYGHESYWMKESRNGMVSIKALQIILPFINLLDEKSVWSIMNKKNLYVWFDKREKMNLKLLNKNSFSYKLNSKKKLLVEYAKSKINTAKIIVINLIDIEKRAKRWWMKADGDNTFRVNYELDKESAVFDVGGFRGDWANLIYSKYKCNVYVFEPIKKYYSEITERFKNNNNIKIYNIGLGGKSRTEYFSLMDDYTSLFRESTTREEVKIKSMDEFIKDNKIRNIDLIKINIEGGEYELLEHIIESGLISNIKNIQVQFHRFFPNANQRRKNIVNLLNKTHKRNWCFPWVWENWKRIDNNDK